MRASNYRRKLKIDKKILRILIGSGAGLVLAGIIAFFVYFHVEHVEVMASDYYTEEEIKEMVLRGPLAYNSVLAPRLYSKQVADIPFVEGFEVRQVSPDTIAVGVIEKQPVGCVPFLDCYIYFDRSGRIIESSVERDEKIPYFDGLEIPEVALEEDLQIPEESVLNTAVSLARIFEKNDLIPEHIEFDEQYQITLTYGEITVQLGKDQFLEDKMARLIAILPKLTGRKGVLHMESVTDTVKTITFEMDESTLTEEENPDGAQESEGENTEDSYDSYDSEDTYDSYDGEENWGEDDSSYDQESEWDSWEDGSYDGYDSYGEEEDSDSGDYGEEDSSYESEENGEYTEY